MGLVGIFNGIVAFIFFIFNFVIFLGAIFFIVVVLRLQSLVETKQDGSNFVELNALIIIGAFVTVVACFGCYGVATDNKCYLLSYITLMIVLIVMQFGFGTYFVKRSTELKNAVFDSFKNLQPATDAKGPKILIPPDYPIHAIQRHFNCCGVDSYREWIEKNGYIPGSCCHQPANNDTCLESKIIESKIPACRNILDEKFKFIMDLFISTLIIYIIEVLVTVCGIYISLTMGRYNSSRYIVNVGPSMKQEFSNEGKFLDLEDAHGEFNTKTNNVYADAVCNNTAGDSCIADSNNDK